MDAVDPVCTLWFHAACYRVTRLLTAEQDGEAYNNGTYGKKPWQSFISSPVRAPRLMINQWDKSKCEPATHIFTAIDLDGQQRSPLILRADDLSMVYGDPSWEGGTDLRPQQYNGSTYLTFFSGQDHESWGSGSSVMLDSAYREALRLTPEGLENDSDPHDFSITDDGTALFTNFHLKRGDCTSVGGPGGQECRIWESAFQELDIATRTPRFTWFASEHVALNESLLPWTPEGKHRKDNSWDFMHLNAVSRTRDRKHYLVSGRHISAVMLINGADGARVWQLGGRENMFRDLSGGRATSFHGQHHARFCNEEETEISVFDNHSFGQVHAQTPGCEGPACSRAVRVRLDYEAMTAEIVSEWWHPVSVQARAQGGHHVLPGGGAMVAWGVVPALTEFTKDGEVCMDVQVGPWSTSYDGESNLYRAYKFNYTATPYWDPEVAVVDDMVYASWNGATEVEHWAVYGGETENSMEKLAESERKGFETAIKLGRMPLMIRVSALDKDGQTLRSSRTVTTVPIIRPRRSRLD
ncbi:ASST-domain-containing protein [Microdochium trichocladiopsis]|uniref:ASST-domain-containing protein n=1 Tax=Microdochium trichocladiopsis TaxID=1682393 RepID=A0A9P8Y664_9PEZI|nr:ASST-domain-containing protein [Microdochium trichocladiopsis]KAH7029790.1 ASST-domain-containing protein [Microdochium trichocladiopsis]